MLGALLYLLAATITGGTATGAGVNVAAAAEGLWDLTPYSTEITSYLGTHTWPTLPSTTSTEAVTACDGVGGLEDFADDGGVRITVAAGVNLTGCNPSLASDTWIEFADLTATTSGSGWTLSNGASRIRVTGGTHTNSGNTNIYADDVTIDGGNWTTTGSTTSAFQIFPTSDPDNVAFVGNTISAGTYCAIVSPFDRFATSDVTIVGNECTCATGADEACFRIQGGTRTLIAANWIDNQFNTKQCVRFYGENDNSLVMDNLCMTAHTTGAPFWAVGDGDTQIGNVDDIGFIENRIFNGATGGGYYDFFFQQNNGSYTCTGIDSIDNDKISTTAAAYDALYSSCTGTETGNQALDIDDSPYLGNTPTCDTDYGRSPLGCGDDGVGPP